MHLLDGRRRALRSRHSIRVHIGAGEVLARVRVMETTGEIKPGEIGFAQLRLESPIVGVLGDRFIIRSYSPQRTIGGGMILDAFATKHRAREMKATHERLTTLVSGNRPKQVAAFVDSSEKTGLNAADLIAR